MIHTFGCSYTKHKWPTWADMIGDTNEVTNWGRAGLGNLSILSDVNEKKRNGFIKEDDTVFIMLSSPDRIDLWNTNKQEWYGWGSIYNTPQLSQLVPVWNEETGLKWTLMVVESLHAILNGINHRIFRAFPFENWGDSNTIKKINQLVDSIIPLQQFSTQYPLPTINGIVDGHPSLQCGWDWLNLWWNPSETAKERYKIWNNELGIEYGGKDWKTQII